MSLRYVLGFLLASAAQAAIIMVAEAAGTTALNPRVPFLTHLLVGQVLGFALLLLVQRSPRLAASHFAGLGASYGFIAWIVVLSVASMLGVARAPWNQDFPTALISSAAFVGFGIIAAYAVLAPDRLTAK